MSQPRTLSQPSKAPPVPILRVPFDAEDRRFIEEGLKSILDTGGLTMGKFTKGFEAESAALCGVKHAVAVSSATDALEIIMRAAGVAGGTVVVPTNTFAATALAAVKAGARVIFADCDPKTLCLDAKDAAKRLMPDTRAVVLVHIGGIITPAVEDLKALCDEKGIALIEDCAHAHGCVYKGVAAGAWGLAGAFSYFPTKPLVSGEGGLITTQDEELAKKARILRNHGKNPDLKNRISALGYNGRMSEFTALIALQQTKKAKTLFAQRKAAAKYYDAHVKGIKGVAPFEMPVGLDSTYYKYILWLDKKIDRARLKAVMKEEYKVSLTGEVYDFPCHKEPVWTENPGTAVNINETFKRSEEVAAKHVCLPLYPGLSEAELERVVESLKAALPKAAK